MDVSKDVVDRFLELGTLERIELVRSQKGTAELRHFLGENAWQEYQELAQRVDRQHLALDAAPNLLFVPGVMGSLIQPALKGGVWWIDVFRTRNHLNDLRLSSDGRGDANPEDQLEAFNVDSSYEPFLTAALRHPSFGPCLCPYDWRKLLTLSVDNLVDRVTKMQEENNGEPVNLVGHSMGGLMIRAALMERGDELWPRLGKIVFIGTPHYGSGAIAGYLKNHLWGFELMALLGLYLNRPTFRSLWGVLAMLPAPVDIYPGTRNNDPDPWKAHGDDYPHPCANFDLYRVESWHLDLDANETTQLQTILDGARDFHAQMAAAHSQLTNEQRERMLVIAGVGYKTLFRLEWARELFGLWKHAKKVTDRVLGDRHREGDGRVPRASAELDGVRVCYVRGVHGGLPNIQAVYEAVFAFLQDGRMTLPRTPEEALSGHLSVGAASPTPTLDGTARSTGDDPGFLDLGEDVATVAPRQRQLEDTSLSDVQYVRLL